MSPTNDNVTPLVSVQIPDGRCVVSVECVGLDTLTRYLAGVRGKFGIVHYVQFVTTRAPQSSVALPAGAQPSVLPVYHVVVEMPKPASESNPGRLAS